MITRNTMRESLLKFFGLLGLCFFTASAQAEPAIEYLTTQKLSHISTDLVKEDGNFRQYVWAKSDQKYGRDGLVELIFDGPTKTLLQVRVSVIDQYSTRCKRMDDNLNWIDMIRYPVLSSTVGVSKTARDNQNISISTALLTDYQAHFAQYRSTVTIKNIGKKFDRKLYDSIRAAKWMQLELKAKDHDTSDRLLTQKDGNEVSLVLVFPQSDEWGREIKNSTFYTYLMDWTWLE